MAIALSGSLVITGSIFATQGITGSFSGNATSASYADTLQGLGSASFAPAATFNTVSQSFATTSGSLSTRVTNLESTSSTVSSSFASTSGSIAGRVTLIEGQYATTGSNTFTGPQYVSEASNAISFTSTASLYTDGGLRVAKDSFVSGTAYFNNITVYGTSSIEYITSSQVNIGSNIITVNTDTPAIRFGGLSVFDSGSTGLTGSIFWDSEKNHWIYSNPSGSSYNSAMLMNGPRNTGSLGNEQGTLNNYVMKGQGGDHITSSQIIDDGTTVSIPGNLQVTGSLVGSSTAAFASTATATGGVYVGSGIAGRNALSQSDFRIAAPNDTNILNGIAANTSMTIKSDYYGGGSATPLILQSGANSNQLYLATSGNIGIGTSSPQANLQVLGTIKVATGNAQGILGLGEANGTTVNVGIWRGAANNPTSDGNYLNLGGYEGIVLATGNAAIGSQTTRLTIASTGAATFGGVVNTATASGYLNVGTDVNSGFKTYIKAGASGLLLSAGSTSSDNTLLIQNEAENTTLFNIKGNGAATFTNTETTFNFNPQTNLLASYNYINFGGGSIMYRNATDIYIGSNAKYGSAGTVIASYTSLYGMGLLTMDAGTLNYQANDTSVTAGISYGVPIRFTIKGNGLVSINNVIASSSNYKLGVSGSAYINGSNNKGIFVTDNSTYASIVGLNNAISAYNPLEIRASGTDYQLYLATNGNVGVGINNPAYPLDLGTGGTGNQIRARRIYASGTGITSGFTLDTTLIYVSSGGEFNITNPGSYPNVAFTINNSGNVGIGTTTPEVSFVVKGASIGSGGKASFYGGGDENNWTANNNEAIRIGRADILNAYYSSIWSASGSSGNETLHWLKFYISNGSNTQTLACTMFGSGNVAIAGALSKGSGSFRIKHPLTSKKNTHELVHSFIEGPKADLIYRGKVRLVAGRATINIDEAATMTEGTFEVLCRDIQCFTSNETSWDNVRGKVEGNILTIECQNTNSTDEISWMVIGERQDEHMMDTDWTDENGKVIVEPLIPTESEQQ